MKINISIFLISFYTIFTACSSDELSKDKAESIIKKCQTEESAVKTIIFYYGTVEIDDLLKAKFPDKMKPYEALEKLGIVKIGPLERVKGIVGKKDKYNVTLTSKGQEYLVSSEDGFRGKITGKFKICEYKFDSVTEIQDIPERNEAKVKVKFIRFNKTPFFQDAHEKRNPKEITNIVTFRKTDTGWKLCDK